MFQALPPSGAAGAEPRSSAQLLGPTASKTVRKFDRFGL
jgi:hypothetical protein